MGKKEPKNFKSAWKELQEILSNLESNELDIDKLAENVKRAGELVEYCQTKLRSVEKELEHTMDK